MRQATRQLIRRRAASATRHGPTHHKARHLHAAHRSCGRAVARRNTAPAWTRAWQAAREQKQLPVPPIRQSCQPATALMLCACPQGKACMYTPRRRTHRDAAHRPPVPPPPAPPSLLHMCAHTDTQHTSPANMLRLLSPPLCFLSHAHAARARVIHMRASHNVDGSGARAHAHAHEKDARNELVAGGAVLLHHAASPLPASARATHTEAHHAHPIACVVMQWRRTPTRAASRLSHTAHTSVARSLSHTHTVYSVSTMPR